LGRERLARNPQSDVKTPAHAPRPPEVHQGDDKQPAAPPALPLLPPIEHEGLAAAMAAPAPQPPLRHHPPAMFGGHPPPAPPVPPPRPLSPPVALIDNRPQCNICIAVLSPSGDLMGDVFRGLITILHPQDNPHTFHSACINQYHRTRQAQGLPRECPTCRRPVPNVNDPQVPLVAVPAIAPAAAAAPPAAVVARDQRAVAFRAAARRAANEDKTNRLTDLMPFHDGQRARPPGLFFRSVLNPTQRKWLEDREYPYTVQDNPAPLPHAHALYAACRKTMYWDLAKKIVESNYTILAAEHHNDVEADEHWPKGNIVLFNGDFNNYCRDDLRRGWAARYGNWVGVADDEPYVRDRLNEPHLRLCGCAAVATGGYHFCQHARTPPIVGEGKQPGAQEQVDPVTAVFVERLPAFERLVHMIRSTSSKNVYFVAPRVNGVAGQFYDGEVKYKLVGPWKYRFTVAGDNDAHAGWEYSYPEIFRSSDAVYSNFVKDRVCVSWREIRQIESHVVYRLTAVATTAPDSQSHAYDNLVVDEDQRPITAVNDSSLVPYAAPHAFFSANGDFVITQPTPTGNHKIAFYPSAMIADVRDYFKRRPSHAVGLDDTGAAMTVNGCMGLIDGNVLAGKYKGVGVMPDLEYVCTRIQLETAARRVAVGQHFATPEVRRTLRQHTMMVSEPVLSWRDRTFVFFDGLHSDFYDSANRTYRFSFAGALKVVALLVILYFVIGFCREPHYTYVDADTGVALRQPITGIYGVWCRLFGEPPPIRYTGEPFSVRRFLFGSAMWLLYDTFTFGGSAAYHYQKDGISVPVYDGSHWLPTPCDLTGHRPNATHDVVEQWGWNVVPECPMVHRPRFTAAEAEYQYNRFRDYVNPVVEYVADLFGAAKYDFLEHREVVREKARKARNFYASAVDRVAFTCFALTAILSAAAHNTVNAVFEFEAANPYTQTGKLHGCTYVGPIEAPAPGHRVYGCGEPYPTYDPPGIVNTTADVGFNCYYYGRNPHNLIAAASNRTCRIKIPQDEATVVLFKAFMHRAIDIDRRNCVRDGIPLPVERMSTRAWASAYPTALRDAFMEAEQEMIRGHVTDKEVYRVGPILKREQQSAVHDRQSKRKAPRMVTARSKHYNVAVGPSTRPAMKKLTEIYDGDRHPIYLTCGSDQDDIAAIVGDRIKRPYQVREGDFKQFETSRRDWTFEPTFRWLKIFNLDQPTSYGVRLNAMINRGNRLSGSHYPRRNRPRNAATPPIRVRCPPGSVLISGDSTTTLSNSLVHAYIQAWILCQSNDITYEELLDMDVVILINGDDSLLLLPPGMRYDHNLAKQLGFELEVENRRDISEATFCSQCFYPAEGKDGVEHITAPKVGRVIVRYGKYLDAPAQPNTPAMNTLIRGAAVALLAQARHVPPIAAYAHAALRSYPQTRRQPRRAFMRWFLRRNMYMPFKPSKTVRVRATHPNDPLTTGRYRNVGNEMAIWMRFISTAVLPAIMYLPQLLPLISVDFEFPDSIHSFLATSFVTPYMVTMTLLSVLVVAPLAEEATGEDVYRGSTLVTAKSMIVAHFAENFGRLWTDLKRVLSLPIKFVCALVSLMYLDASDLKLFLADTGVALLELLLLPYRVGVNAAFWLTMVGRAVHWSLLAFCRCVGWNRHLNALNYYLFAAGYDIGLLSVATGRQYFAVGEWLQYVLNGFVWRESVWDFAGTVLMRTLVMLTHWERDGSYWKRVLIHGFYNFACVMYAGHRTDFVTVFCACVSVATMFTRTTNPSSRWLGRVAHLVAGRKRPALAVAVVFFECRYIGPITAAVMYMLPAFDHPSLIDASGVELSGVAVTVSAAPKYAIFFLIVGSLYLLSRLHRRNYKQLLVTAAIVTIVLMSWPNNKNPQSVMASHTAAPVVPHVDVKTPPSLTPSSVASQPYPHLNALPLHAASVLREALNKSRSEPRSSQRPTLPMHSSQPVKLSVQPPKLDLAHLRAADRGVVNVKTANAAATAAAAAATTGPNKYKMYTFDVKTARLGEHGGDHGEKMVPSAVATIGEAKLPRSTRFSHREYLSELMGTSELSNTPILLNPGNPELGKWLPIQARCWTSAKCRGARLIFQPSGSTAVSGFVGLSIQPNPNKKPYTTTVEVMDSTAAVETAPWQGASCELITDTSTALPTKLIDTVDASEDGLSGILGDLGTVFDGLIEVVTNGVQLLTYDVDEKGELQQVLVRPEDADDHRRKMEGLGYDLGTDFTGKIGDLFWEYDYEFFDPAVQDSSETIGCWGEHTRSSAAPSTDDGPIAADAPGEPGTSPSWQPLWGYTNFLDLDTKCVVSLGKPYNNDQKLNDELYVAQYASELVDQYVNNAAKQNILIPAAVATGMKEHVSRQIASRPPSARDGTLSVISGSHIWAHEPGLYTVEMRHKTGFASGTFDTALYSTQIFGGASTTQSLGCGQSSGTFGSQTYSAAPPINYAPAGSAYQQTVLGKTGSAPTSWTGYSNGVFSLPTGSDDPSGYFAFVETGTLMTAYTDARCDNTIFVMKLNDKLSFDSGVDDDGQEPNMPGINRTRKYLRNRIDANNRLFAMLTNATAAPASTPPTAPILPNTAAAATPAAAPVVREMTDIVRVNAAPEPDDPTVYFAPPTPPPSKPRSNLPLRVKN